MHKMAKSSFKQQFSRALYEHLRFGQSKHLHKKKLSGNENDNGFMESNPLVFSDSYKKSLQAFINQAAPWLQIYSGKRLVVQLTAEHWSAYIETKVLICSSETIGLYYSHINKLAEMCNSLYKSNVKWTKGFKKPKSLKTPFGELLRTQQMSQEDFDIIMAHATRPGTWSRAPIGWELSRLFGFRVHELEKLCVKNCHLSEPGLFGYGYIDIVGKGKRYRKIHVMTQDIRDYVEGIITGLSSDDRIVNLCKKQINEHLRRAEIATGLAEKYNNTGIHSIRKLFAQTFFDWCQSELGYTEEQSYCLLNSQLGHSLRRGPELTRIYVKSIDKKLKEDPKAYNQFKRKKSSMKQSGK